MRFERHSTYHAASSQLSRFGNSVAKTWRAMELKQYRDMIYRGLLRLIS
jgi:hypothetical protein